MGENFEWPNSYWFIAERTNGRLAMIGFMAVIINFPIWMDSISNPLNK